MNWAEGVCHKIFEIFENVLMFYPENGKSLSLSINAGAKIMVTCDKKQL